MIHKLMTLMLATLIFTSPVYAGTQEKRSLDENMEMLVNDFLGLSRDVLVEAMSEMKEDLDNSRAEKAEAANQRTLYVKNYDDLNKNLTVEIVRTNSGQGLFQKGGAHANYQLELIFRNSQERSIVIQGLEENRNLLLIDTDGFTYLAIQQNKLENLEIFQNSARKIHITFDYTDDSIQYLRLFGQDIEIK